MYQIKPKFSEMKLKKKKKKYIETYLWFVTKYTKNILKLAYIMSWKSKFYLFLCIKNLMQNKDNWDGGVINSIPNFNLSLSNKF